MDVRLAAVVGELIRDLGEVPSGEIYASIMDRVSLDEYNAIVQALVNAKLVKQRNYLLTWVGPVKES